MGEWGASSAEFLLQVYLLVHFVTKEGLSSFVAGTLISLMVIWDAISDPLMGFITDRSQYARHWMLSGCLVLAGSFLFLFGGLGILQSLPSVRLGLGLFLVNTGITMFSIPHLALTKRFGDLPHERESLYGWRFLFTNFGFMSAVILPSLVNWSIVYLFVALIILLGGMVCFYAIPNRQNCTLVFESKPFSDLWKAPLGDTLYLWILGAFFLGSVGRAINSSTAIIYYEYRLGIGETQVFSQILLPFSLIMAPSIAMWLALSRRFNKARLVFWAIFLLGLSTSVVYPLLPKFQVIWPAIYGVFGGLLIASIFLFDAMVSDLASQQGGRHGVYFGLWRFTSKVSRAFGLALTGWVLERIGFGPGIREANSEMEWFLALLFGPGVGLFFIASAWVFRTGWKSFFKKKVVVN